MKTEKTLLNVKNLKTHFFKDGEVYRAVDGVSFVVYQGETVGLVGESGCGKSMLALSILGLVESPGKIVDGIITFKGRNLLTSSSREMEAVRGSEIAMIFQEPMTSLNPVMSCGKQIEEAILTHTSLTKSDARVKAEELLKMVKIPDPKQRYKSYPHELSGGMRQRVMIAMALANQPELLIADEPTTALDVTIQEEIVDLLSELQSTLRMSVLFISHDINLVGKISDRIMVMYAGQIVEEGPTDTILSHPQHPYTKALMGCIPSLELTVEKLPIIPGSVPLANRLPSGCRFHPRCSNVNDDCSIHEPEFVQGAEHQKVRCPYFSPLATPEIVY